MSGCTVMNARYSKALVQGLLVKIAIIRQYSVPVASLSGWWSASTYMGVHVGILTVLVKLGACVCRTLLGLQLSYEDTSCYRVEVFSSYPCGGVVP